MIFKIIETKKANSFILGHTLKSKNYLIKKGKVLNKDDISLLIKNNINNIYVAIKEKGDCSENFAAKTIANHISTRDFYKPTVVNGRADIFSKKCGLFKINKEKLLEINYKNEDIAICTLNNYSIVKRGQLVANVKILPYAIDKKKVAQIVKFKSYKDIFKVAKRTVNKVGLISTSNENLDIYKSKVFMNTNNRLKTFGLKVNVVKVCKHNHNDLNHLLKEMLKDAFEVILIYGETSISDLNDVIPKSIVESKGRIISSILPTDPGNLLLLAKRGRTNIIGVPGCAKSIKRNGFDSILERVCYGGKLDKIEISKLAVGGLYKYTIRKFE